MTITKAEILTNLNAKLDRSETDIDEEILAALKWLSLKDDFLWVEAYVNTIIGRKYYSLPLDYKDMIEIKVADNRPLRKITWEEYQTLIADETSANRAEPTRYCIHGGFWYAYPTPDAIYKVTLFYPNFVLESEGSTDAVDDIAFSDIYRDAIYCKTKAIYCRGLGWTDEAILFELELRTSILPLLERLIERVPKFVKNTDL